MYDLMRLLWPEVSCAVLMGAGSVTTAGAAMEANDSPTNCAVLDEGESEVGGGTGVARSDTQYLIRWTELSMLLDGDRRLANHR